MQSKNRKNKVMQPLTAMVPAETRRRLQQIAESEQRMLSAVVRIALEEFIERRSAA